jgi:hypothetical protein
MSMIITQEDIARRIIEKEGCGWVSCDGCQGSWNQGVECPFFEGECTSHANATLNARAWLEKRRLFPYSSTFTIAHRFKPGDRVQHKDETGPSTVTATVAEVMFGQDCGAFYRFAEDGTPTGSVSYCDENLRLADCQDKSYPKGEMQ